MIDTALIRKEAKRLVPSALRRRWYFYKSTKDVRPRVVENVDPPIFSRSYPVIIARFQVVATPRSSDFQRPSSVLRCLRQFLPSPFLLLLDFSIELRDADSSSLSSSLCIPLSLDSAALEIRFRPIGTRTSDRAVVSPFTHEWISLGVHPRLTGKRDRCEDGRAFDITANLPPISYLLRSLRDYVAFANERKHFNRIVGFLLESRKKIRLIVAVTAGNRIHVSKRILLSRSEDLA